MTTAPPAWADVEALLERVDWRALARWLASRSPAHQHALTVRLAQTGDAVDVHQHLAGLVILSTDALLRDAVTVAADGLARDEAAALRRWLRDTAAAVHGRPGVMAAKEPGGPVETAHHLAGAGELVVEAGLPPLPLVALASDMASEWPGGLVVRAGALGGCAGLFSVERGVAIVILDLAVAETQRRTADEVFAHELAHGLDPGRVWPDEVERERFADALASLLLHRQPVSVDEAMASIADALVGRPAVVPDIQVDRVMSMAAFLTAEVEPSDLERGRPRTTA